MAANVSKRLRFGIFHRDDFTCQYCGNRPPGVILELDHIHPLSKGGDNQEINLVTACHSCNLGKLDGELSNRPIRQDAHIKYLEVLQEMAEAERFIAIQEQREELTSRLIVAIKKHWSIHAKTEAPLDRIIREWLSTYPPEEITSAVERLFARTDQIWNYLQPEGIDRRITGALRRAGRLR